MSLKSRLKEFIYLVLSPFHNAEVSRLYSENIKLKDAIRNHRDQKSDDRCWLDDQELYKVLGDGNLGDNCVGDKDQMLKNCERYLINRCQGGKWATYAELEEKVTELEKRLYPPLTVKEI